LKSEFIFLALLPEETIRREMDELKIRLSKKYAAKKALSSTSHITLYPPIHLTPNQLQVIQKNMLQWSATLVSFNIQTKGVSCFGKRTVFIDVGLNDPLNSLNELVRKEMKALGHPELVRPFKPHFTLLNRDTPEHACEEVKEQLHQTYLKRIFPCHSFVLFRRNAANTGWDLHQQHVL
jgi:2'-5' RNA ligase